MMGNLEELFGEEKIKENKGYLSKEKKSTYSETLMMSERTLAV
jgi:hypothetical protein